MIHNKYSNYKIVWFRDKLNSFINNEITAPIYVRIKPTNKCCHNCYFCVYNYKFSKMHETTNKIDEIPLNKMIEILDDLKDIGTKAITYSGGGEPLVHKDIIPILKRTLDNKIDLSILTNGQLLSDGRAEILTQAKWIRISIDYFSSESFILSRFGSNVMFEKIQENISKFCKSNRFCEVGVNFIVTNSNYNNLMDSTNFLFDLGVDNIRFSPVWIPNFVEYHYKIQDKVLEQLNQIKLKYKDKINIYDSYKIKEDVNNRSYSKCYFMQVVPVIGADLNVYNCHNKAYSKDGIIGSIKKQKFSELWFSDKSKEYFNNYKCDLNCNHQCANDSKNVFLHEIINSYGDNYV